MKDDKRISDDKLSEAEGGLMPGSLPPIKPFATPGFLEEGSTKCFVCGAKMEMISDDTYQCLQCGWEVKV